MSQRAKTLESLGWPALVEHLAGRCHTARGSARALALPLFDDVAAAQRRAAEIAEARLLYQLEEPMPFGGLHDIELLLGRAAKGGDLEGAQLMAVGQTIAGAARLKRHLAAHAA